MPIHDRIDIALKAKAWSPLKDEGTLRALPTGEQIAVAFVLDRCDLIPRDHPMLKAFQPIGPEVTAALRVQRSGCIARRWRMGDVVTLRRPATRPPDCEHSLALLEEARRLLGELVDTGQVAEGSPPAETLLYLDDATGMLSPIEDDSDLAIFRD